MSVRTRYGSVDLHDAMTMSADFGGRLFARAHERIYVRIRPIYACAVSSTYYIPI